MLHMHGVQQLRGAVYISNNAFPFIAQIYFDKPIQMVTFLIHRTFEMLLCDY